MLKRKTTEAQRSQRRGATIASVPSVPRWFKTLDKNLVLFGPRRQNCVINAAKGHNLWAVKKVHSFQS